MVNIGVHRSDLKRYFLQAANKTQKGQEVFRHLTK
jgi:hypothetical protein